MDIKLIALDLDGTLLDSDHVTVPRRNVEALAAAAQQGVVVTIATGRAWKLLGEVIRQMDMVHYAVLSNGAAVMDAQTEEFLFQDGLPEGQCRAIVDLLLAEHIPFELYCDGRNYLATSQLEILRGCAINPEFMAMFERNAALVDDLNAATAGKCVEKVHLFSVPPAQRAALETRLNHTGPLSITQSFRENMELTRRGVNKQTGMASLCAKLGILPESVMVFGDAGNDLEVFRWAGWSFAMENGSDEAKAAAKYRTGTNHDGGVGAAIERYVLKS